MIPGSIARRVLLCTALVFVISGCDKSLSPPTTNPPPVTPPPATSVEIFSVNPAFVSLGAQDVEIKITGTGFVQVSSVDLGSGIHIASKEIPNPELIRLIVNVGKSAAPGPRKVTVRTATATAVLEHGFKIINNHLPEVRFTFSPETGSIFSVYQFDATASTDDRQIVKFHWEFGDGDTANGVTVKHRFGKAGTYTVRLTVTDSKEATSSTEKQIKVVENLAPTASFTVSPQTGYPSTVFVFDGSSSTDPDGELEVYQWDFGDGTAKGAIVHHNYSAPGTFQVVLRVKDNANAESIAEERIKVEEDLPTFDENQAIREINEVVITFLELFARFEELSAEQIVVGFSSSSGCRGREHEINIIRDHQQKVLEQNVDIYGPANVTSVNEKQARALLSARFYGTYTDGTTFDGVETHDFSMIFEGEWKICNFTLQ